MRESVEVFQGIKPRVGASLLAPNEAQIARMVKITQGHLRPWDNQIVADNAETGELVRTIYLYLQQYWLTFSADVDILPGPIAGDTENKLYYTGDGIPKKTNEDEATTGAGDMPINYYPMGVPTPAVAAVAALGAGGSGDARVIAYVWTVVTSWGEEGPPSPGSNTLTALQGQQVNLSGMSLVWQAAFAYTTDDWIVPSALVDHVYKCVQAGTSAGAEPAPWGTVVDGDTADGTVIWRAYKKEILYGSGGGKRIYRVNTGDAFSQYQFVDQIPQATTVYADTKLDTDLAEALSSQNNQPPPDGLIGLVSLGRFFAGFVGKEIYFSEANFIHAWPSAYQITLDYPIVGLGTIGNILVVGTTENPYVIYGTHPSVMQPQKFPDPHPCLSKRGIDSIPQGVLFPTTDGLYLCGPTDGRVVSKDFFTKEEWKEFDPASMNSEMHDSKYFAFYRENDDNQGGLVMQIDGGFVEYVTELDFHATAVFNDETSDILYYIPRVLTVRLREAGTPYPTRSGIRLTEAGGHRLLE
jgi:hypothetical protein